MLICCGICLFSCLFIGFWGFPNRLVLSLFFCFFFLVKFSFVLGGGGGGWRVEVSYDIKKFGFL